jgi:hypothetical protein
MMKSLSVFTMIALLGTAAIVGLPVFAPQVKANEPVTMARADQLPLHSTAPDCSKQIWPNYDTSCLHRLADSATIQDARLVNTHR